MHFWDLESTKHDKFILFFEMKMIYDDKGAYIMWWLGFVWKQFFFTSKEV